jgi:hypothetical protein
VPQHVRAAEERLDRGDREGERLIVAGADGSLRVAGTASLVANASDDAE